MTDRDFQLTRRQLLGSMSALVLMAGCRSIEPVVPPEPEAAPEADGARQIDRERLAELVDSMIAKGLVTCAVCGAQDGITFCRGNRRPLGKEPVPVDEDSLFEVASVAKVFTAAIAGLMWCEGKLDIDAPVIGDVTIRDLATHTSGLTDSGGLRYPRGQRYHYCCRNFIVLGRILEERLGMDLDAAARKYVWGPLGMTATTWKDCPDDPRVVQIYTHGPVPLGLKGDEQARKAGRPLGNAGVFTGLRELLVFATDILERRTFPKEYYDLICTPTADFGVDRRSFGWNMSLDGLAKGWSARTIFHTGYTGQYLAIDPENGKAGAVLTNLIPSDPAKRRLTYRVRRELLAIVCGSEEPRA